MGITRVDGRVIGDESAFDGLRGSYDSRFGYDSDLGGELGGPSTGASEQRARTRPLPTPPRPSATR